MKPTCSGNHDTIGRHGVLLATRLASKCSLRNPLRYALSKLNLSLAQLALGCHHHLSSSADGGIEACSGRGIVLEAGEVEPPEVAVEVFCGDAAVGAQEGFEALVATVDGLDV